MGSKKSLQIFRSPQANRSLLGFTEEDFERNRRAIKGKNGFFSIDVSYIEPDEVFPEGRKVRVTVFHPLGAEAPCPCGSGEAFGHCCAPLGSARVFALNPDGEGYSPIVFYSEIWEHWNGQGALRNSLNGSEEFFTSEDTKTRSFWNYRGEKTIIRGPGPMVFGTVEMTPDFLKIHGVSRLRYESLRAAVERTLGKALPPGKVEVSLPTTGRAGILDVQPDGNGALLEEYRKLRERQREINRLARQEVMRDELLRAAKDLEMLGPGDVLVFEGMDESGLLADYSLFEVKRHGESIIQHFMRKNPPADERDKLLYEGFANSLISIFQVDQVTSGVLSLRDLLVPGREFQLVDFNLSSSALPGVIFYVRLLPLPRFAMTGGGWNFAIDAARKEEVLAKYLDVIRTSPQKMRVAKGILFFKRHARSVINSLCLP